MKKSEIDPVKKALKAIEGVIEDYSEIYDGFTWRADSEQAIEKILVHLVMATTRTVINVTERECAMNTNDPAMRAAERWFTEPRNMIDHKLCVQLASIIREEYAAENAKVQRLIEAAEEYRANVNKVLEGSLSDDPEFLGKYEIFWWPVLTKEEQYDIRQLCRHANRK
jgi:hypothetical protein